MSNLEYRLTLAVSYVCLSPLRRYNWQDVVASVLPGIEFASLVAVKGAD